MRPHMDGYGVPEGAEGLLDWSWAEERLARTRNYWVGTATPDGRPHSMPVWGIWLPEVNEFVFSCSPTARKARNLRRNPRMVLTTDDSIEVVSVEGSAVEVRTSEIYDVIARLADKYESDPDKAAQLVEFLGDTCGFRFQPERAFAVIERPDEFGPRATKWVW